MTCLLHLSLTYNWGFTVGIGAISLFSIIFDGLGVHRLVSHLDCISLPATYISIYL